jgi:nicotinamide riboside transporter PnuC
MLNLGKLWEPYWEFFFHPCLESICYHINWNLNFDTGVIHEVTLSFTLSFTPYPLFQWNLQSKESLLNLSMKCWNSASNAQGSRVIIVVIHVGGAGQNICKSSWWCAQEKRKDRMKLSSSPTKIGGKTSLGPSHFIL